MEEEPLTKEPGAQPDNYNSTESVGDAPPVADKKDEGKKESDAADGKDGQDGKEEKLDFVPAFILSCLSFWFCGLVFGGVAFILAIVGKHKADSGNKVVAGRLKVSSYVVSVLGILVGMAFLIFFLLFYNARLDTQNTPFHG